MKQKEYSKKQKFFNGVKEIYGDLYPLFKKLLHPVKNFLLTHPKRTAIIMFSIILLNTVLLFIIIHHKSTSKQAISYSSIIKNFKNKNTSLNVNAAGEHISIGSLFEIKNIRDSLEYLMRKKAQTKEDTLCFIRLYKRYRLIDPSIADALKELKKKKKDSLHLKTPVK